MTSILLRPDAKGRISLGEIAKNVSSYKVTVEHNRKVLLEPYIEIPLPDKWILEDKELLERALEHIKTQNAIA